MKTSKEATPTKAAPKKNTPKKAAPKKSPVKMKQGRKDRWKVIRQLGESGKEGTVYEVKDNETGKHCAMKEFKANKAQAPFKKEAKWQQLASEVEAGPAVLDVLPGAPPRMVMEAMSRTIQEVLTAQKGSLTQAQQEDIVALCGRLDEAMIYHNDANPLNLMEGKDGKFKWIDYGMSKEINVKNNGLRPNTRALKAMLHSGMQGLVSRKIWTGDYALIKAAYEGAEKGKEK